MTTGQKIMRGKGGLLDLANQLGNVSQRRGNVGYGRESSIGLRSSTSQGGRSGPAGDEPQEPGAEGTSAAVGIADARPSVAYLSIMRHWVIDTGCQAEHSR